MNNQIELLRKFATEKRNSLTSIALGGYEIAYNEILEFIDNIDDMPSIDEFDDEDKNKPKLLVIDDFINLSKKELKKIMNYHKVQKMMCGH